MPIRPTDPLPSPGRRAGAVAALLAALALAGLACSKSGDEPRKPAKEVPVQAVAERFISIPSHGQSHYGDLWIGVGPVRTGAYTFDTGERSEGRVAELWLTYRGDATKNSKLNVHIGQRVGIGKYVFHVADIRGGSGSVNLRFEAAEQQ